MAKESANIIASWMYFLERGAYSVLDSLKESMFAYFRYAGQFKDGLEFFETTNSCADLASNQEYTPLRCSLLQSEGYFLQMLGRFEEARAHYEKALSIGESRHLKQEIASAHNALGELHIFLGDYELSKQYIEQAASYHKRTQAWKPIFNNQNLLGALAQKHGNYSAAMTHFETALEAAENNNDLMSKAIAHNNMGNILEKQENYLEAKKYYEGCLEYFEMVGIPRGVATLKTNLGFIAWKLGDLDVAEKLTAESLELKEKLNSEYSLLVSKINLGEIYLSADKPSLAKTQLLDVIRKATEKDLTPLILEALPALAEIFSREGHVELAHQLVQLMESHPKSNAQIRARAKTLKTQADKPKLERSTHSLSQLVDQILTKATSVS